jgi:hypothetical protein
LGCAQLPDHRDLIVRREMNNASESCWLAAFSHAHRGTQVDETGGSIESGRTDCAVARCWEEDGC